MNDDKRDYRSWALLNSIRTRSRFSACKARTEVLSADTGMAIRTVEKYLRKLEDLGAIQRFTSTTRMRKGGLISQQRTIYLVSIDRYDIGAQRLASLVASFGRSTNRKVDVFCGRLGCTPKQLREWFAWAKAYGWLDGHIENDNCSFTRIGDFDSLVVRDPTRQVPLGPLRPPPTSMDRLTADLLHALDGPVSTATNEQLAVELHTSVRSVKRAISALKRSKKLQVETRGRTRLLVQGAFKPTKELLEQVLPLGPRVRLLAALDRGPLAMSEARAAAGCSAGWFRVIVRRARAAGQVFTGTLRGVPGISLRPLTENDALPPTRPGVSADPMERGTALYAINNCLVEVAMARSGIPGRPTAEARGVPHRFSDQLKLWAYEEAKSSGSTDPFMDVAKRLLDPGFEPHLLAVAAFDRVRVSSSPSPEACMLASLHA